MSRHLIVAAQGAEFAIQWLLCRLILSHVCHPWLHHSHGPNTRACSQANPQAKIKTNKQASFLKKNSYAKPFLSLFCFAILVAIFSATTYIPECIQCRLCRRSSAWPLKFCGVPACNWSFWRIAARTFIPAGAGV